MKSNKPSQTPSSSKPKSDAITDNDDGTPPPTTKPSLHTKSNRPSQTPSSSKPKSDDITDNDDGTPPPEQPAVSSHAQTNSENFHRIGPIRLADYNLYL